MLATLERDGYAVRAALMDADEVRIVARVLDRLPLRGAGTRILLQHAWCRALVLRIRSRLAEAGVIGAGFVAVQCTLFDKTAGRNWLVGVHQDLSIPVRQRVDHPDLQGWATKEGEHYVQPPVDVLQQLVAVRMHIDDSTRDNGPLRLVPGSHSQGRLSAAAARRLRDVAGEQECLAQAGDALLMRPLVLHASSKAARPFRRRVLHIVFGPTKLPCDLEWKITV